MALLTAQGELMVAANDAIRLMRVAARLYEDPPLAEAADALEVALANVVFENLTKVES